MSGGKRAVESGAELERVVAELGKKLGLETYRQYKVARRIWGAERKIDVVMKHPTTGKTLGIECKVQDTRGTAEEKYPSTIQDISAWPIGGILVFSGQGFTENMKNF